MNSTKQSAQHTPKSVGAPSMPPLVRITISPTIDNEYANRLPEWLAPDVSQGVNVVGLSMARAILSDAEYNSDRNAVDVGPYGTPLPVFNAYRALAKQVRGAIAKATGSQA